jgi:tetratricopeptide (TPR) repeat protein
MGYLTPSNSLLMRIFLPLLGILSLTACRQAAVSPAPAPLSATALFEPDSVRAYLTEAPDWSDSSRRIFMGAIDLFRNKGNASGAVSLLLSSLRIYPSAAAYYELGNVYLEKGDFQEALNAYTMAEKMEYAPLGNLLFQKACCYAELNSDEAYQYLTYAIENGYARGDKVFSNRHFKSLRNDDYLRTVYAEAMAGNGDPEALHWQSYSRAFPRLQLPFQLDSGSYGRMKAVEIIPFDYETFIPEMRDYKFSRDVGNEFFYVGRLAQSPHFTVVIYGCRSYEQDGSPIHYMLASFSSKGKLIDKKLVAGAKTFDAPYREARFSNEGEIEIKLYKLAFAKDPEKEGYEENSITGRELLETQLMRADSSGKFILQPTL